MSKAGSDDTPALAYAKGKMLGSDLERSARDCPYLHDQQALRAEWMRGFSEGRVALKKPRPADGHG